MLPSEQSGFDWSGLILGLIAFGCGVMLHWVIIPQQTIPAIFSSFESDMYPNICAFLIMLAGAGLALASFFTKAAKIRWSRFVTHGRNVLMVSLAMGLYLTTMRYIGFVPSGAALMGISMLWLGERNRILIWTSSILIPLIIWVVFEVLLERPLP